MDQVHRRASPPELDEVISIDDDACALYDSAGLHFDFGPDHPFARAEWAHWARAADAGNVYFAVAEPLGARPVGVLVMDRIDGAPYLEQLSVRMSAQQHGVGRRLLQRAAASLGVVFARTSGGVRTLS